MKLYDLSVPVDETEKGFLSPKVKYTSHKSGGLILGLMLVFQKGKKILPVLRDLFLFLFGVRRITAKDFPGGIGLSKETVTLNTHTGTHVDSPNHYGPKSSGRNARTIDEVPLEWCFGDGLMLDFSGDNIEAPYEITKSHITGKLEGMNMQLKPGQIVLIKTLNKNRGIPIGMSREAVEFCVSRGIKMLGIDSGSIDKAFTYMLDEYIITKDKNKLWPAHIYGRKKEYCHIENLDLEAFNLSTGFKVACFPVKIKNAGAGWSRVVALVE